MFEVLSNHFLFYSFTMTMEISSKRLWVKLARSTRCQRPKHWHWVWPSCTRSYRWRWGRWTGRQRPSSHSRSVKTNIYPVLVLILYRWGYSYLYYIVLCLYRAINVSQGLYYISTVVSFHQPRSLFLVPFRMIICSLIVYCITCSLLCICGEF